MAKISIICEHGEHPLDVEESLVKAFQSKMDMDGKFADPVMEELAAEADAWFNYYIAEMMKEILTILTHNVD